MCSRRPPRCCCTTTSTAASGRRPSSSSPREVGLRRPADAPTPTSSAPGSATAADSRLAGALPRDVRPHRRGDADAATRCVRVAARVRRGPGRRRRRVRRGALRAGAAPRRRAWRCDEVVEAVQRRASARARRGAPRRARRSGSARCSPRCGTRPARARSPSWRCATATTASSASTSPGAEAGYPPTRHLDAFEYLQRENAHFTIHAGEAFGLPSIWEAIQWCGADRLGHGVRIVDDITVGPDGDARPLGRLAAYVRDKRIPLEMCPTSNVQTGAAASIAEHPIGLLAPAAVPGHGQHRQPADERHVDDPGDDAAGRGVRLGRWTTCGGSRSTR